MAFSVMRVGALLVAVLLVACSRGAGQTADTATPAPSPIPTAGLPAAPSPPPIFEANQDVLARAKRARVCALKTPAGTNPYAAAAAAVDGRLYVACGGGLLIVDRRMHVLRSQTLPMYQIQTIKPAGAHAIAAGGYTDGAALQNQLSIVNSTTLKPIVAHAMSDSTFLGVIGDRAYIDDWCCFGRSDQYAPATIYWVSLKDGTESRHVDLAPDPQSHPANLAPLGQGEHNYMLGRYFYVVVTDDNRNSITCRYDVFHLNAPPVRMRSTPQLASL